jgi:hypothetical protein
MNNNISLSLAKKVFSSHKIKSYENTLFNTLDCEGYSLMEKAGKFAFQMKKIGIFYVALEIMPETE